MSRPAQSSSRPLLDVPASRTCGLLVSAALLAGLAACAPDAWKPSPIYDAFLNKVDKNCGTMRIGEATISQLINPGSNLYSAYFVDLTSRFELGRIDAAQYADAVSTTFTTIENTTGIRCIIAQRSP